MRDVFDNWIEGLEPLIIGDSISFYTYFTTIFAEISFLWAFFPNIAIPFTILLPLCIVNVCVCYGISQTVEVIGPRTREKYNKKMKLLSKIYLILFCLIFIVGCFFNIIVSILTMIIPFAISELWAIIRKYRLYYDLELPKSGFRYKIYKLLHDNKFVNILSLTILLIIPIGLFITFLALTPLSVFIKVIIVLVYLLLIPFISLMEDEWTECTGIFEAFFLDD